MKFLIIFIAFVSLIEAFYIGLGTKNYQRNIQRIPLDDKIYRVLKKIYYYAPYAVMLFLAIELSDLLVESCYWVLGYGYNSLISDIILPFLLISGFIMICGNITAKPFKKKQ